MKKDLGRKNHFSGINIGNLGILGIVVGSIISFYTTYSGLKAFSGPDSEYSLLISFGITFLIQFLLCISVIKFRQVAMRKKLQWLLSYFVCVFFSVTLSIAFWVHYLEADKLTSESARKPFHDVEVSLGSYLSSYKSVLDNTTNLSDHSDSMAVIESKFGNSCGYNAPTGEGPRFRQRRKDQQQLNVFKASITGEFKTLDSLWQKFDTVKMEFTTETSKSTEESVRNILERIEVIHKNKSLDDLKSYLVVRINKEKFVYNDNDDSFQCPDATFDTYGQMVLNDINSLPPPPSALNVRLYDGSSAEDAVRLILGTIMSQIGLVSNSMVPYSESSLRDQRIDKMHQEPVVSAEALRPTVVPLTIGILVDLLILFSSYAMPKNNSWAGGFNNVLNKTSKKLLDTYPSDPGFFEEISNFVLDANQKKVSLLNLFCKKMHYSGDYVILHKLKNHKDMILLRLMDVFVNAGYVKPICQDSQLFKYLCRKNIISGKRIPKFVWQVKIADSDIRNALRWIEKYKKVRRSNQMEEPASSGQVGRPGFRIIPDFAKSVLYDLGNYGWKILKPMYVFKQFGHEQLKTKT